MENIQLCRYALYRVSSRTVSATLSPSLFVVRPVGMKLSEFCASSTPQNKCITANKTDGYRVACSNGFHEDYLIEDYLPWLQTLMLCHWPMDYFDPAKSLRLQYKNLTKLTITNGLIKDINGEFPEILNNLKILNLSHLHLNHIKYNTFIHLSSLEVLDLSHNKLNILSLTTVDFLPKLKQIWLAGESWFCKFDMFWLLHRLPKDSTTFKVMDSNRMICGGYKYKGKPAISILRIISDLEKECPSGPPNNCVCTLDNVVRGMGALSYLHAVITVDCSYRDLKTLPKRLPHNVTTLLVQGNQISTLDELVTNDYYAKLLDIYLDYNRISSISILEGSMWLARCRILSVKGNNLTKVPTYALDYAFQRNSNIAIGKLYLGNNPWRCDCLFTPSFQDFLIKYRSVIKDPSDIKCSFLEDDEYYLTPIHDLPRNTLCRNSVTDMVNFWDSLNVLLASLIVALILKFIYDYIVYKKFGRLPWIITVLP